MGSLSDDGGGDTSRKPENNLPDELQSIQDARKQQRQALLELIGETGAITSNDLEYFIKNLAGCDHYLDWEELRNFVVKTVRRIFESPGATTPQAVFMLSGWFAKADSTALDVPEELLESCKQLVTYEDLIFTISRTTNENFFAVYEKHYALRFTKAYKIQIHNGIDLKQLERRVNEEIQHLLAKIDQILLMSEKSPSFCFMPSGKNRNDAIVDLLVFVDGYNRYLERRTTNFSNYTFSIMLQAKTSAPMSSAPTTSSVPAIYGAPTAPPASSAQESRKRTTSGLKFSRKLEDDISDEHRQRKNNAE